MRSIRSSLFVALLSGAAFAQAPESDARRAAALFDYVARGYALAVTDGRIVNAPEFDEQVAFTQEAAELLERLPRLQSLAPRARELEQAVRARAPGDQIAARAFALEHGALDQAGLGTAPPLDVQPALASSLYAESCAACHGAQGRGDGFAASTLSTRPTDFTGPDRATLTPYRVYSAVSFGVPHTAMPAFEESLSETKRWQLAMFVLTFGQSDEDAQRGAHIARERRLDKARLVAQSDAELRQQFGADAQAVIAWARRIAPFAGPPPAGFPLLRTELSLATIAYVHGRGADALRRFDGAEATFRALLPVARATAPDQVPDALQAFAASRRVLATPGQNARVLASTAHLARKVAEAGPETPDRALLFRAGVLAALDALPAALLLAGALLALSRLAGAAAVVAVFFCTLRARNACAAAAQAFGDAAPMIHGALAGGAALLLAAAGAAALVQLTLRGPLRGGAGLALCALGAIGVAALLLPA